jgi:hypothetical protein
MQKLAFENEGLEFESIHVSFSDASSNRRKRSSEFATTSIETTFRTVEDAPADITASVKRWVFSEQLAIGSNDLKNGLSDLRYSNSI